MSQLALKINKRCRSTYKRNITKIKVQAGEDAKVKAVLGIIGEEGEDIGSDDDDSEETTQEKKITTQRLKVNKHLQMENNLITKIQKKKRSLNNENVSLSLH